MQRYDQTYGGLELSSVGCWCLHSDAEAAIEQARRDERAKCVAELSALAMKESDELAAKVQELQNTYANNVDNLNLMAADYRRELRTQVNAAWMRLDYTTADRIATLIGDPKPSDHEKADLKPAGELDELTEHSQAIGEYDEPGGLMACNPEYLQDAEWPEVWEKNLDGGGKLRIIFHSDNETATSQPADEVAAKLNLGNAPWRHSTCAAGLSGYKLVSKGGKAVVSET